MADICGQCWKTHRLKTTQTIQKQQARAWKKPYLVGINTSSDIQSNISCSRLHRRLIVAKTTRKIRSKRTKNRPSTTSHRLSATCSYCFRDLNEPRSVTSRSATSSGANRIRQLQYVRARKGARRNAADC